MASARTDPDHHDTASSPAPAHAPDPLFRTALSLLAAYGLLMLLIIVGAWALITQDWVRQQKVQEVELTSLSHALSSKLESTVAITEQTMRSIAHLVLEHPDTATTGSLVDKVHREIAFRPALGGIIVWQADGRELASVSTSGVSSPYKASPAIEYFDRYPNRESLIHSAIREGDGRMYLPVERVQRNARGKPVLYLYALVPAQGITHFFESIKLSSGDEASLLDEDGRVLLEIEGKAEDAVAPPDFASIVTHETTPRDKPLTLGKLYKHAGSSYLGVFHWLGNHPLIMEVSRPSHIASAGFLEMRQRLIVAMSALLVILALLAWLVYYDARRHRAAREALRKINASLEHRVHLRTAELEQSNRELIAFSHSVSHDLRAPLRAINGFAHALREDYGAQLDEQARNYMDRVCRASIRLGELIDELLSLTNLSRTPLDIRDIDLGTIALEIVDELRLGNPEKQVEFQCDDSLQISADEALLRNALSNLIGNAWKFTRSRTPAVIRLKVEDDGDFRRYTLSDNGIGFDMAHAKRLFQPFQQLHGNQGFGGSGIGLASVRRIIERHGGQIWAEARPDEGAHFIFTLPVRPQVIRRQRAVEANATNE